MRDDYKEKIASKIAARYISLEERILQDIARRIKKVGEITSTADWQINRLRILGYSSEDIEREIKKTLDASYPEMFELYDKVIDWEYVRNKDIYEQINAEFIPYEENRQLQQITDAIIQQSLEDLENVTKSLGFYLDYNGRKVLTPLSQVYTNYLDNACFDIVTGAFDYGSVLRRVVTQLTNSGLRKIEYGSGYASRVEVAARRAVMTGVANLTGEIADYNAKKLGTEYFEVEWHAGARPAHSVWQGRVWTKDQLHSVCGLGTVTGLLGANCYHTYYPFFPGISERNWSDDWLEEQNRKESKPKEFRGKEYTLYEAKQRQRQMETAMRAQREKVQMLQDGGADPDEVMLQKAKYQGQLNEYAVFSRKMGLKEERERIYIDGRGWIATNTKLQNSMFPSEMIQNALKDIAQYKRYKEVLGDSVGTLAKFGQVKYNDSEEWEKVQSKFFTYLEIDKKDWSEEFKNTSKQAYDRFAKENVVMSVHALSRLPRLNKLGLPEVSEEMLIKIIKGTPNYTEGEDKQIYFIHELQLLVVRNKKTGDIVSVVRRRAPKEAWGNV
ncbi:minor capsid protein [Coprococcus comes]|uniref:Minor capsid protein n=1 Tax=Coprococcus comes TaxID=410072 RepID=A0A414QM98_9FIRM|nr:phage minor capsid protein [Coprococcus comes]DAZ51772.1 MAG TPA: minor capsid protein [Caudoviricetes sp.]NSC13341.1 minor capsid protein [Coprococcus comes]NSC16535.1 minor capsid protein [Coprococcus comes]NSC29215.1 minor capsid protein [Coprococcus comes]NSC66715.1 minor capsid protein [Coprococcus comes]